ncbi:putative G-protein coupled receptor [Laetiporus sulphureus 93-53]|uniref:Putative G-protein coupled receptor n=1 Tax=Laetiporus sulphureus 93-53 TaxID=1314785 RepID=A0A165GSU5_9APHY|nr:putative G-protein coupled receptor [Laetiporus sulphureus 93-53]KZT10763.1 putative G-protein coupled receptor [Laetiporus sulphureus 93-53]
MATVTETAELRRRRVPSGRRFSTVQAGSHITHSLCQSLPHSLEALDLHNASLIPSLATLRHQVLSCLADLEARLSMLDSPISPESLKTKGELTVEEARTWARDGLQMLRSIRDDVCSHFPDFNLENVKSHMPDVSGLDGMRAHLPDMPDVRSRLPDVDISDMRARLDDIRSRISDIDFYRPRDYVNTLSEHLQSLQAHLSSFELPHSIPLSAMSPSTALADLYDRVISSELISEISSDLREGEKVALDIACAVKQSLNGSRLIQYVDLPHPWRNNPFVMHGYRFIPLQEWPRLIMSLFALHNETLNIHTHLIPFVAWLVALLPFSPFSSASVQTDPPVLAFTAFALLCLFTSALWHTMAGCAHPKGMELCARIDYVGIGWLISASVGTVVHYGFRCNPMACSVFLTLCLTMGLSGSILPFTEWFNKYEYRGYRIAFFVALAFTSIAPLACLAYLHSTAEMLAFIRPISPSFASYIAGLVFYATHFPECYLSSRWAHSHVLDRFGGGSHAIWHIFIVVAISQHKAGMDELKRGIGEACW